MVREQIVWFYSPWNAWGFSCGWMAAISASLTLIPPGVAVGVGFCMHGQCRAGGGSDDEVHDDLMAGQWSSPPVHRDLGEQVTLIGGTVRSAEGDYRKRHKSK